MDYKETIPISEFLEIVRTVISNLRNIKGSGMRSIFDILAAQPKGYDMKFSKIWAGWYDSIHKDRINEKDYEASIRTALDRVRGTAIRLGVKPPYLTSSYMLIETIDGLSMDHYEEDYLYNLIGTQLWNNSPLSRVLYDVIEHTITKRGVSEYRVIPRDR